MAPDVPVITSHCHRRTRSDSPLPHTFLPFWTSRKQQVRPDSYLSTYCWKIFLIVMSLGHIHHLLSPEPNQGLAPSYQPWADMVW